MIVFENTCKTYIDFNRDLLRTIKKNQTNNSFTHLECNRKKLIFWACHFPLWCKCFTNVILRTFVATVFQTKKYRNSIKNCIWRLKQKLLAKSYLGFTPLPSVTRQEAFFDTRRLLTWKYSYYQMTQFKMLFRMSDIFWL